jgi:hypothetical protein
MTHKFLIMKFDLIFCLYCRVSQDEANIETKKGIKNSRRPFLMIFSEYKNEKFFEIFFKIRDFQMTGKK